MLRAGALRAYKSSRGTRTGFEQATRKSEAPVQPNAAALHKKKEKSNGSITRALRNCGGARLFGF